MNSLKLVCIVISIFLFSCWGKQQAIVADDYTKRAWYQHKKPGAALSPENTQVNLEFSGVQYVIDPVLISGYDDGELMLSVRPSDGLYILDRDTDMLMPLSRGKISVPFTVMAAENGRYYLYLNAKLENGSGRALTFIVQVGDEKVIKSVSPVSQKTGEEGEIIVPLTAKEEIIN